MSFEVPKISYAIATNAPISFGAKKAASKQTKPVDTKASIKSPMSPVSKPLVANPPVVTLEFIEEYINKKVVENAIEKNPEITRILKTKKLKPVISKKNIDKSLKKHCLTTYIAAMEIVEQINNDKHSKMYITPETRIKIAKASLVHDIGKALIPESIIQKRGALTPEEREIVDLHSQLGAEILKTTNIDPEIVKAVGKHHYYANNNKENIISEIVSVADVYSALKEERPYKDPMTDHETFSIMFDMPNLSDKYIRALYLHRRK